MTEPENAKDLAPVEANQSGQDSADDADFETPILAVWLTLGAIVVSGLYGLYLGTNAKAAKQKADTATVSAFTPTRPTAIALSAASISIGRHS